MKNEYGLKQDFVSTFFEKLQLLLTSKSDNPIESVSKAHVTELVSSTANERTDGRTDVPWREPTPTSALPQLNNSTDNRLNRLNRERLPAAGSSSCHWWPQQWASASRSRLAAATMRRVAAELSRQMASSRLKRIYRLHYLLFSSVASCPEISHRWRNLVWCSVGNVRFYIVTDSWCSIDNRLPF